LRKAFFVTNRVKVIAEPQEETGTGARVLVRPELATRITESTCHPQPIPLLRLAFITLNSRNTPAFFIFSHPRATSPVEIVTRPA
jgi:hypothetical protein